MKRSASDTTWWSVTKIEMAKRTVGLIPEPKEVRELELIYSKFARKIRDEVFKLDVASYSEVKAMRIRKNVDWIVHQLNRTIMTWSRIAVKKSYLDSRRVTQTQLLILGFRRDPNWKAMTHLDAIKRQVQVTQEVLLRANYSIKPSINSFLHTVKIVSDGIAQVQEWDMRNEEVISGLLDRWVTEGASRNKIKNLILEHFRKIIGAGDFININGRNYNLKSYAKMVARTRLRKVQSDAVVNMAKEYDSDLVEISDHGTDCASNICQPYEGQVYSLSGKTPGYAVLDEYPPFHPNCEHNMFPTSEEALAYR